MADNKKMVAEITSMNEDFAKWYTDIVKKAELIEYTSVKGCMVCSKKQATKMCVCRCSSPKVCFKKKKTTLKVLLPKLLG